MKIAVFYYDEFAEFEIVLACLLFKSQGHEIVSVALEKRDYRSEEGQRFCVDHLLEEVEPGSIDLLIVPGGNPEPLVNNPVIKRFVEEMLARDKKVAGICGGAAILAGTGFLDGKRCTGLSSGREPGSAEFQYFSGSTFLDDYVVVDGNMITAQGQAYVEFAFELARQMGLSKKEEEYAAGIRWFKNMR